VFEFPILLFQGVLLKKNGKIFGAYSDSALTLQHKTKTDEVELYILVVAELRIQKIVRLESHSLK